MIVVDTSALMAIVLRESEAARCRQILLSGDEIVISAATLAETLIVSLGKNANVEVSDLLDLIEVRVEPVTEPLARKAAQAHRAWGKGRHPAGLNFGDCFAYALAKELGCPLLFVGNDFSQTDAMPA